MTNRLSWKAFLVVFFCAAGHSFAEEFPVPGGVVNLEWRSDFSDDEKNFLKRWLAKVTHTASQLAGTFPREESRVVIERARRRDSRWPVPWGQTLRRGTDGVLFQVNTDKTLQQYVDDWTAPHEFSHLFLPYPGQRDIWLSEGFASYYQNILMAREGIYSGDKAWQKLYEGFMRAEQDSNGDYTLTEVSENRRRYRSTMRVYWSGALFFMEADIALRKASDNKQSLDWVLDRFVDCCRDQRRRWNGRQMLASFDEILATDFVGMDSLGENYFTRLYQKYSESMRIPDSRVLFAELGIQIVDAKIEYTDNTELKNLREDITRPRRTPLVLEHLF